MTERLRQLFQPFALDREPVWSSYALEQAVIAALERETPETLLDHCFTALRPNGGTTPSAAHFVRDLVKTLAGTVGVEQMGKLSWVPAVPQTTTPAQALLITLAADLHRMPIESVVQALASLEPTEHFAQAVRQLSEMLETTDLASAIARSSPELAQRTREALAPPR